MAQLFGFIRNFFTRADQSTTQDFIRLQLLGRIRREQLAAPGAGVSDGDNLERGTGLEQSKNSLASLYSLLRFLKIVGSAWDKRFPGWRSGIAGFTILASIVLVLNISALAWTATHLDDGPYATLAVGSYESISNLLGRVHFGINILSTALLAGSNYCMQCLSSPTRAEVDAAHARGSYLNIGILSWRNVLASRKRRICLLTLLTLSSVVMHPVYDTSLTMTTALQSYTSALVTPEILSGEDLALSNQFHRLRDINDGDGERLRYIQNITTDNQIRDTSLWENISAIECAEHKTFETERSTLLIVTSEQNALDVFSYQSPYEGPLHQNPIDPRLKSYATPAHTHWSPSFHRHALYPVHKTDEKDWAITSKWHTRISYCLRRKVPGRSRLHIHLWLLLTTTVLNAMKLCCLVSVLKEQQGTPLVTTGDAIESFLRSPCVHTTGMCLLFQEELACELKKRGEINEDDATPAYKRFEAGQLRYHHSVSFGRWLVYISSFMLLLAFSVYECNVTKRTLQTYNVDYDLRSLWKTGLGKLSEPSLTETTLCDFSVFEYWVTGEFLSDKWIKCRESYLGYEVLSGMILSNLPKLCVSAIYLSLNHQLTLMVQLRDWAKLTSRRQALRVSNPEPASNQVSTYWLSLPYRYSIPLLLTSVSFGWLVPQTLYFIRFAVYDDIKLDEVDHISYNLGFSAIALTVSILFGIGVFGVSVAIGFCKCAPGMPLGPSNSLVIAAACHPPETDRYSARKMVKWGAIPSGDNAEEVNSPGHCTITSGRVKDPIEGQWYA